MSPSPWSPLGLAVGVLLIILTPPSAARSARGVRSALSSSESRSDEAFGSLSPVVFIPGHGGNQLDLKLDMATPVKEGCPTKTKGWIRDWVNLWQFLPANMDCWAEFNKLTFDEVTERYSSVEGVEIRVPGWGETRTIEYLDPSVAAWLAGVGSYAAPLIKGLRQMGYVSGLNLRGAPYDFRYGAPSMPNFYDRLRRLVEATYRENGNVRVTLLAHSMGGPLTHYFLVHQDESWKRKYVQSMVTLNSPWRGSVMMVNAMISGYTWRHKSLHPLSFRNVQRACESSMMMLPSPAEWSHQEVLVTTPDRNYTLADLNALFRDLGFPQGQSMWKHFQAEMAGFYTQPPGVDAFCVYSSGVPTPDALVYGEGQFPDDQPQWVTGDGDGTVNLRSAAACRAWQDTDENMVVTREFPNTSHNGILKSKDTLRFLREVLVDNM